MDLDWHLMPISEEEATLPQPPLPHPNPIADTRPRKKKARTLRETDWEPYKDRIIQLHHVEKRPLPEVRILIEQEFGFIAEIRQYRSRLTQWKLDKNIKSEEMRAIVRHRQQRDLIETSKPALKFRVRGQEVEPHKIERWMKRHDVIESMIYAPSPLASTPSAVSYTTMSEIGSPGDHAIPSHGSLLDVNTDSDSDHITPLQAFIQLIHFPKLTVRRVGDDHVFAKCQYQYSQHDHGISFRDVSVEDLQSSLPTAGELAVRLAVYVGLYIVQFSLRTWVRSCFPQTVEKLIILRFYIRQVPPTMSVNVRVYVQIPSQFSSSSWNIGFDLTAGRLRMEQCNVAWTSGIFRQVHLPESLLQYRTAKVPWDELQSFTWPGDDMD